MKDFFRQALWLSVLVIPIPAGAFAVHTPDSLAVSFLSFTLLSVLVPFFYFQTQKTGYGAEEGTRRSAVHLANAPALLSLFWVCVWFSLRAEEALWKEIAGTALGMAAFVAGVAVVFLACFAVILRADYALLHFYDKLSAKGETTKRILALSFFIGWIPGWLLGSLLFFSVTGLDRGLIFFFYMTTGMTWILYLKILLAMMGITFYLYFSETGSRGRRMLRVIFTALFWLMLLYLPLVTSLRLPSLGAWRAYADPSYLSICPFLSDLWLAAAAYLLGKRVVGWIYGK